MSGETHFTVTRGEVTLRGSVCGDGPELLFLHGLTGLAAMQRGQAPLTCRVAAYDQRGHGNASPVTRPEAFAIDEFVADAIAVLDHLDWQRPIVCGTSMGAAVALRLALDHPDRARLLALIAPAFSDAPNADADRFELIARGVDAMPMEQLIPLVRKAQIERGFPPEATRYLDLWIQHDRQSLAAALRVVGSWVPFPDLDRIASLTMPLILASWPDDTMHPDALAERIARLAGGAPIARIASLYDGLAHPEHIGAELAPLIGTSLRVPARG